MFKNYKKCYFNILDTIDDEIKKNSKYYRAAKDIGGDNPDDFDKDRMQKYLIKIEALNDLKTTLMTRGLS